MGSVPKLWQDEFARRLGLGAVVPGSVRDLKPGDRDPVWALDTETGRWVVKTARPAGPWWYDQARRAAVLESAAADAGISVPRSAAPVDGAEVVGLWTKAGDRLCLRAMERVEGAVPSSAPVSEQLARWVGTTLAGLEAVAPRVAGAWDATGYATHPVAEWAQWLDEGREAGLLSVEERDETLALVSALNAQIEDVTRDLATDELRLLHRDVSRVNIIVAPSGPVLLDFDHAGPQRPWWEAVCHVFQLASPRQGPPDPDRAVVAAALDAYRAAGGVGGPATAEAFTGMLAARLSFAAWLLWNACGHRGGDGAWRRKCGADFRVGLGGLRSVQRAAVRWAKWLG